MVVVRNRVVQVTSIEIGTGLGTRGPWVLERCSVVVCGGEHVGVVVVEVVGVAGRRSESSLLVVLPL